MGIKEVLANYTKVKVVSGGEMTVNINKAWTMFNLYNGYNTLWTFRGLVNQLVDNGELEKVMEQPRGLLNSQCGKTGFVLHPKQQEMLDRINKK